MSPNAVNDVASSFVQMAKAYEELPLVQSQLNEANNELIKELDRVTDREYRLIERNSVIEELHSKIRELEAKLDSTETMFLEADERTNRALDFIKAAFGSAGSLIQALEPPKPEVKPEGFTDPKLEATGQSASHPTAPVEEVASLLPYASSSSDVATGTEVAGGSPWPNPAPPPVDPATFSGFAPNIDSVSVGQGEVDPTPKGASTEGILETATTSIGSGAESGVNVSTADPSPGPYAGKRYIDVIYYVSESDWLAGGGTWENYHKFR